MFQDLRYGIRLMLKNKLLTAVALLSLSLGIGANTAIFSIVNAVMVRPLGFYEPDRLVKIYQSQPDPAKGMFPSVWAYPRFEILRDQTKTLAAVAGFAQFSHNLSGTDDPERLAVETVSASYFPLLGIEAIAGRTFTADEDKVPGANLSVLIGSEAIQLSSGKHSSWTNMCSRSLVCCLRVSVGRMVRPTSGRR